MNLYEQLEIGQTATEQEIKKAYFRLIRKHTPEKDPETFKRLRKAYETLSDRDARTAYDKQLSQLDGIPSDAAAAIMKARQMCENKLAEDAVRFLEKEIKRHKRDPVASDALQCALCAMYMDVGKAGKAVSMAEKLVKKNPDSDIHLRLAIDACLDRGWKAKAEAYKEKLLQISPLSEEIVLEMLGADPRQPSDVLGRHVEQFEGMGQKAPIICVIILLNNFHGRFNKLANQHENGDEDEDEGEYYEQLNLFGYDPPLPEPGETAGTAAAAQPWDDLLFAARKLAGHSTDTTKDKREALAEMFIPRVLRCMYDYDRFDIFPEIDRAISNIGNDAIIRSDDYKIASVGYMALQAVQAGIPKTPAAYAVMRVFSQAGHLNKIDLEDYKNEVVAYELDILLSYDELRNGIKRMRDEFNGLYSHAADFLSAIGKYNELRLVGEIERRISKLRQDRVDDRLSLDWLGEDDDLAIYRKPAGTPVRVEKIGRNEPCPCGSGKKYKKCCGR